MRHLSIALLCLLLLLVGAFPWAEEAAVRFSGYLQLWYLYEQVENGKRQDLTMDLGAQAASGFSLNRARLGATAELGPLEAAVQLRLEGGSVGLLDAYALWRPFGPELELMAGQMKVPSAWEVAVADEELEFATRSRFAAEVVNWSLSRSPASTSPFTSVQTASRDLGVALRGELRGLRYHLMLGNGLGVNNYVGAEENRQFVYANGFGAYLYAGRLSYDLLTELRERSADLQTSFTVGGHLSYNHHPNLIYNDGRTVLDLERWSWSTDGRLTLFDRLELFGMYGAGRVEDDVDADGEPDYLYSGWEAGAVVRILPGLVDAGARWDSYTWSRAVTSGCSTAGTLTLGLALTPDPHLRFQLNYKRKLLFGSLELDTDNDLAVLSAQLSL